MKYIITPICFVLLVYSLQAFALIEPNPFLWEAFHRGFLAFSAFGFGLLSYIAWAWRDL